MQTVIAIVEMQRRRRTSPHPATIGKLLHCGDEMATRTAIYAQHGWCDATRSIQSPGRPRGSHRTLLTSLSGRHRNEPARAAQRRPRTTTSVSKPRENPPPRLSAAIAHRSTWGKLARIPDARPERIHDSPFTAARERQPDYRPLAARRRELAGCGDFRIGAGQQHRVDATLRRRPRSAARAAWQDHDDAGTVQAPARCRRLGYHAGHGHAVRRGLRTWLHAPADGEPARRCGQHGDHRRPDPTRCELLLRSRQRGQCRGAGPFFRRARTDLAGTDRTRRARRPLRRTRRIHAQGPGRCHHGRPGTYALRHRRL